MDDAAFDLALSRLKELYELCSSDNLSLTALQQKVELLDESDIQNISRVLYIEEDRDEDDYPLLHRACMNKNVTLEIVKYLVDTFPNSEGKWSTFKFCPIDDDIITEAYPIHCACLNENCPTSVIEYFMDKFPSTLEHLCIVNQGIQPDYPDLYISGLPLHYYLTRTSNIDIDTVKMLVDASQSDVGWPCNPISEAWPCYPIHLLALSTSHINLEIIQYFLDLEPTTINLVNGDNETLLHRACYNEHLTLEIYQFIFNKWPEAIRMIDEPSGWLPIHNLCRNNKLDDSASVEILRSMVDTDPNLVRVREIDGYLPIHLAIDEMSNEFCIVLIDAYPESVRIESFDRLLIHEVCSSSRDDAVQTIQYLLQLYPEGINARDHSKGWLPIHHASDQGRADIIGFLLKHYPDGASKKTSHEDDQQLPLHIASCGDSLEAVQVLFDAYPEALNIRDSQGRNPLDVAREENMRTDDDDSDSSDSDGDDIEEIVNFLQTQLVYAQIAQDTTAMTTPDEEGYLPIHRALLQGDASLGSIKLLVRGSTEALQVAGQKGVLPLHIACRNATADIVRFLADSYDGLDISDTNKDYPLHYACRAANLDVIKYLMGRNTSRVSTANNVNKLPFHLLIESENEQVRDSLEFTEACFLLLRAHPEAIIIQTTSRKRRRE